MRYLYEDFVDEFISIDSEIDISKYAEYKVVSKDDCHFHVARSAGNVNLDQEFIQYGRPISERHDILFHARAKSRGMCKNLERGVYDKVFERMSDKYKISFIGTTEASYCPDGASDLRDIPLKDLANIIHSSRLVVGESSGPIHFASLCATPHLTWGGYRLRTFSRYTHHWNPFKTNCFLFETLSDNYLTNRIRFGARVPRDILEQDHVNIIESKSPREPSLEDMISAITSILK
tara:strand:+ start:91096 stop:91797 length:702 start_codon:yes stop_codon:yes gene_type:complete